MGRKPQLPFGAVGRRKHGDGMTTIAGVPSRGDIRPGMASFLGTGPAGKTCGDCEHRGRWPEWGGCTMYRRMAMRTSRCVAKHWEACRYFTEIEHADGE